MPRKRAREPEMATLKPGHHLHLRHFHQQGTTTITRVRRANGRQPVAAAAEGTATGTAMQQQRLVEYVEKGQTPDEEEKEQKENKEKKKKKRKAREEASKLRSGQLGARSPLTYQQERAVLCSYDRGFPFGWIPLDEKFRRCGGSRCFVHCVTTFSSPLLREIHFTIDSALAFTSPPRPGARSFAKGITTRRRERRQTDGKGDAEGKRTAKKKERETVRDGEGEKEKEEEEEEEKTAGGGREFLARRTQTAIAKDESERRSGCGEISSLFALPLSCSDRHGAVAPHHDVELTKEAREIW
ncbi:hypothetical protein ALC62_12027 [Cyphomyrmex costatus]|uniref:Uncharacterized protein n=1 Tax=Cyphomyrmex costatus TaxID=456900 RepID=A0A195C8V4_9HYME|nr:hypothetical protein ALC62_12027 [Cyphomyrmex costatus]